jgi:hypothetical protein
VNYECGFLNQGQFQPQFTESHTLRYFFDETIETLAKEVGFEILLSEESFSGLPLGEGTWSALFLLRKN